MKDYILGESRRKKSDFKASVYRGRALALVTGIWGLGRGLSVKMLA